MRSFILFTLIYNFSLCTGTYLLRTVWARILIAALYTAVLFVYYLRTEKKTAYLYCRSAVIYSIPLFTFSVSNLITITEFSLEQALLLSVGAVSEELLFRGLLIRALSRLAPIYRAIISSLIFALYHLVCGAGIILTICAFCFGYALSAYAIRYKRIIPCILAHTVTNFCSSGVTRPIFILACILISVIYGCILIKNTKEA